MENIITCPVCENKVLEKYLNVEDYFLSKEIFKLDRCKECGFVFTNPRPTKEDIGPYYKSDEYFSHADSKKNIIQKVYGIARNFSVKKKYNIINSLLSEKGSILDYGCGTGEVLSEFKRNGWKTFGVEPDDNSRKYAINSHQINISSPKEYLENKDRQKFNVISLWHVLEHIHNLNPLIQSLLDDLNKNGFLIIAVPNIDSYDAKYFGKHWAAYDVPRHLYHFNDRTIIRLFEKHNLKLVKKLPMKLDSFYVSMLSNQYKSGSKKIINSFLQGLRSNIIASKKNGSYSSTIYIFHKNDSII